MRNNKGFSLVELIIVIAILAILMGVMAPQLIRYVEKSHVSADTQLCDSVRDAIIIAANDPAVISANDNSSKMIAEIYDPGMGVSSNAYVSRLASTNDASWTECEFSKAVEDILGFNPFNTDVDQKQYFKSNPASKSGALMSCSNGDHTDFAIFIQHSDSTGKKQDNTYTGSMGGLLDANVIYAN